MSVASARTGIWTIVVATCTKPKYSFPDNVSLLQMIVQARVVAATESVYHPGRVMMITGVNVSLGGRVPTAL